MFRWPGIFRRSSKRHLARRRRQTNTAIAEILEDRALLAGNVVAAIRDGSLLVTGDADDNSIEVVVVSGNVIVRGLDGTTVNGNTGTFTAFAATDTIPEDLRVRLGRGDNSVRIADGIRVGDNVFIQSGDGEDIVDIEDATISGDLKVATSSGDDLVTLEDSTVEGTAAIQTARGIGTIGLTRVTIGEDLRIATSREDDNVVLLDVTIGDDLTIKTSRGDDTVGMEDSSITDDVKVSTGHGDDAVVIDTAQISDNTKLITSRGDDSVVIEDSTLSGNLKVDTSRDDDLVHIDPTTVTGDVRIRTSRGDDTVVVQGENEFDGRVSVDGGPGENSIELDPANDFASTPTVRNADNTTVNDEEVDALLDAAFARWQAAKELVGAASIASANNDSYSAAKNQALTVAAAQGVMANDDTPKPTGLIAQLVTGPSSGTLTLNPDGSFTYTPANNFVGTVTFTYKRSDTNDQATATIVVDPKSLTVNTSSNETIQSSGILVTDNASFRITGITTPGATVSLARDNDGQFNDGSTVANANGEYILDVTLVHDNVRHGANSLKLRSIDSSNTPREATVDVHYAVGTVTRFTTPQGTFDIELLDDAAPLAVENFLELLSSYTKSIIHRSIDGFVIQGGGFTFDATTGSGFQTVQTVTPIVNEFNANNPNRAGTLSMALVGGNINSGTTQWFINTVDNPSLDTAKHTVFGRIIGTGMTVVNAINDLTTYNLNGTFPESSLATVPLTNYAPFTRSLAGTVSVSAGSMIVNGTGTAFTTELRAAVGTTPGSVIRIGDQNFTVASIQSNTQLTLSAAHVVGATNASAKGNAAPAADSFVRFSNISEIL